MNIASELVGSWQIVSKRILLAIASKGKQKI